MSRGRLLLLLIAAGCTGAGLAAPRVPRDPSEVLERLPFKQGSAATADLRAMRAQLAREPANHEVAAGLARRYFDLADSEGDPRFIGYAQGVLGAWWNQPRPPVDVLLMRAAIRQYNHDFPGALADLSQVVDQEPRNARAWAWRKVVNTVLANYADARTDCERMQSFVSELTATLCFSGLDALTGNARGGYERLGRALEKHRDAPAPQRLVVLTLLAEMAERMGEADLAERHFEAARGLGMADNYLLARYADFLLDQGRPQEAAALLKGHAEPDTLLLRLALAEKALEAKDAARHGAELQARFDAARARGDHAHLGEEARFVLSFRGEARKALELAQRNWKVQREPRDARILLEAAIAAGDPPAAQAVMDWLDRTGNEDRHLGKLARTLKGGHQ